MLERINFLHKIRKEVIELINKKQRRRAIWKKTKGLCAHCGRKTGSTNQTIDHFIPKAKGGTYDYRNLMPLCKNCNHERACKEIDPFKYYKYAPASVNKKCMEYKKWLTKREI